MVGQCLPIGSISGLHAEVSRKVNQATEVISIGHSALNRGHLPGELRSDKDLVFFLLPHPDSFRQESRLLRPNRQEEWARADRSGHIE